MNNNFTNYMRKVGIACNEDIISDGKIHRFANNGKGEKNCWYTFHGERASFGEWGKIETTHWFLNETKKLSIIQQEQLNNPSIA